MTTPVIIGDATLYCGDCREILPTLGRVDAMVTDPPYPNNAGHFDSAVEAARSVLQSPVAQHVLSFWDEIDHITSCGPHVATHIWYRTNTNRPDNYEPIYEFHADGRKRASRVLPYCVIFPGLTGIEASGHPTEKNPELMEALVKRTEGTVLDPFMGSGTTGVACAKLGRRFIGIEIEPKYFDIACRRIEQAYAQPDMFVQPPVKPTQEAML
jgi:site-specific DNA-methyltransferase (adenine-specific)